MEVIVFFVLIAALAGFGGGLVGSAVADVLHRHWRARQRRKVWDVNNTIGIPSMGRVDTAMPLVLDAIQTYPLESDKP